MTVEEKEAGSAANAGEIEAAATAGHPNQALEYLEIKVEKTSDSSTEPMSETSRVLAIVIPYDFKGREYVTVYRSHNGRAETLVKSGSGADGTYQTDEENGFVTVYASRFSTYAIGYTQCYNLSGSLKYGAYTGEITLSLLDEKKALVKYATVNMDGGLGAYSFTHIPQGTYFLSAKWFEGNKEVVLEKGLNVQ